MSELMERFFIEHGTIHDRKTGRHVRTDPEYGPNRTFGEDGIEECCALLNQFALAGFDREIELRAQLAQVTKERDEAWYLLAEVVPFIVGSKTGMKMLDKITEALAAIRGNDCQGGKK